MTVDESATAAAAIAALVAAAFGGLFGLTGFIVGLIGLRHARQAKESAAAANLISKDANALAESANVLSEESNGIAREAHELSRETKERENELHDVAWEWSFGTGAYEGMVEVVNVGKSIARETTIQFRFDDVTESVSLQTDIEGRMITRLEIPGLREATEGERRRRVASKIERDEKGVIIRGFVPFSKPTHVVRLRLTWRTTLGSSREFDSRLLNELLPE